MLQYPPKEHRQNAVYSLQGTVASSIREISSVQRASKIINCEYCLLSEPARAVKATAGEARTRSRCHAVTEGPSYKKQRSVEFIGLRALSDIVRYEEMVCGDIAAFKFASNAAKRIKKTK